LAEQFPSPEHTTTGLIQEIKEIQGLGKKDLSTEKAESLEEDDEEDKTDSPWRYHKNHKEQSSLSLRTPKIISLIIVQGIKSANLIWNKLQKL
jgi:hypothetical protein